jgi:hypothetical protein
MFVLQKRPIRDFQPVQRSIARHTTLPDLCRCGTPSPAPGRPAHAPTANAQSPGPRTNAAHCVPSVDRRPEGPARGAGTVKSPGMGILRAKWFSEDGSPILRRCHANGLVPAGVAPTGLAQLVWPHLVLPLDSLPRILPWTCAIRVWIRCCQPKLPAGCSLSKDGS